MKLFFATEARFIKNKQGIIYAVDKSFSYDLWLRYLESFSEVHILARVYYDQDFEGHNNTIASGNNVYFKELPYYIGWVDFIKNFFSLKSAIKKCLIDAEGVFICRIPGIMGGLVINRLNKLNKEFGVEVVGDPWDVMDSGGVKIPFRKFIRYKSYIDLKNQVKNAIAVLYVTKEALQKRYPSSLDQFVTNASDVKISIRDLDSFKKHSRKDSFKIISVGSLAQLYKGPDVLIKSLSILKKRGLNCKLIWLGDGKFLEEIKKLTITYGIYNDVEFLGNVPYEKVNQHLDNSDLFVLASRTEGLPRAIVEAMALGLPCVATRVGGIPELLEDSVLVEKDDELSLANKIQYLLENPDAYDYQAERNFEESKNYMEENLNLRRNSFYDFLIKRQSCQHM